MKFAVILVLVFSLVASAIAVIKLLLSAVAMAFVCYVLFAILRNAMQ